MLNENTHNWFSRYHQEGHLQPLKSGDTELVSEDEESVEHSSGTKLSAMPGLKRNTIDSSISDTSEDFHSPISSDNSTETIDSAKLKHPKKSLHEIYPSELIDDTPKLELPRVTRSKLPTTSSTCNRKCFSEGENEVNFLPTPLCTFALYELHDAKLFTE